ncbi:hypothetical protein [Anaerobacillus alkalidiazotrophicus]|uniref:hypothetical protein n=1 Tax=Anaerobacillus alkalidiazotrophicus TaxID=472963 RepID=UPI0011134CAB|nr:hypothetical protein [Anaerobacillus alkalidiazotrophicus]
MKLFDEGSQAVIEVSCLAEVVEPMVPGARQLLEFYAFLMSKTKGPNKTGPFLYATIKLKNF